VAPESTQEREARSRTRLANERTYLAWWRTGLTCFAVAIGVGKLLPVVGEESTDWPYAALGVAFALLGLALIGLGYRRFHAISRSIESGEPTHDDFAAIAATTVAGVILAAGVIGLVLFAS
jgi:putative membrane protein